MEAYPSSANATERPTAPLKSFFWGGLILRPPQKLFQIYTTNLTISPMQTLRTNMDKENRVSAVAGTATSLLIYRRPFIFTFLATSELRFWKAHST